MIPSSWSSQPTVNETPVEVEHMFRGPALTDWLVISFMEQANPGSNIRDWVEAMVAMPGFRVLAIK